MKPSPPYPADHDKAISYQDILWRVLAAVSRSPHENLSSAGIAGYAKGSDRSDRQELTADEYERNESNLLQLELTLWQHILIVLTEKCWL